MANRPSGLAKWRPDVGVTSLGILMNLKQTLPSINHLSVPLRDPLRRCRRSVLMTRQQIESFSPHSHPPPYTTAWGPKFCSRALALLNSQSYAEPHQHCDCFIGFLGWRSGWRGFDVFDAIRLLRPSCLHCETPAIRSESCCGWWLVAAINKMLLTLA